MRRFLPIGSLAVLGVLAGCSDGLIRPPAAAGPAAVSIAASLNLSSGGIAEAYQRVDQLSVRVLASTDLRLETVVPFDPTATESEVSLDVPLEDVSEAFTIELELRAGEQALFRGSGQAQLSAGGTNEVEIPITPIISGVTCAGLPVQIRAYGAVRRLTAAALFASGDTVPGVPIAWSTASSGIVTVNQAGDVTGLQDGSAEVVCSAGGFSGNRAVQVFAIVATVQVSPAQATAIVGGRVDFTATRLDSLGNLITGPRPTSWFSADTRIATVGATGQATGVAPGTVAIRATSGDATGSATLTVSFPAPVVATVAATGVGSATATLNGEVNPQGVPTQAWFEWGTNAQLAGAATTPPQQLDPGNVVQSVNQALGNLQANQTYYFRVVASSVGGTVRGGILSFNTVTPPTVTSLTPVNVAEQSASLRGTVNPNGAATNGWFEWGIGANPTSFTSTSPSNLGSGYANLSFSQPLTGLQSLTTYSYRVAASNVGGTSRGSLITFTTSGLPVVAAYGSAWAYSEPDTSWVVDFFGSVTPNGAPTDVWIQWSADPNFAGVVNTQAVNVGSGFADVLFTTRSLIPDCGPWYYRAVASNINGVAVGATRSTYCEGGGE